MEFQLNYSFIKKLQQIPGVKQIWLYGSRARGTSGERADIDLALVGADLKAEGWKKALEIIENADTLLEIDLVWYDGLEDGEFKTRIFNEHKVLWSSQK